MTPRVMVDDPDFTLWVGNVTDTLTQLADGSVDCVITSPPYWGLRDYGTGSWDGGAPDCDHQRPFSDATLKSSGLNLAKDRSRAQSNVGSQHGNGAYREVCGRCGARRVDQQLGLEPTPDEYVANMVAVFREVRRVLAPHGTCFVNLGDSYASAWACDRRNIVGNGSLEDGKRDARPNRLVGGLKEKDLVGIPWRTAFALQADGWYLRSDIVWSKPNPMPESVTDRPTKAHEYVFLLTRQPRYWFDAEAVREPHQDKLGTDRFSGRSGVSSNSYDRSVRDDGLSKPPLKLSHREYNPAGRNVRSVWEIATQPYPEAHFATYPEELVRRCLLAGCPEWVCRVCGKPRERIVSTQVENRRGGGRGLNGDRADGGKACNADRTFTTLGWSDCGHGDYRPGVVLDPFLGSGTTALVARRHGRATVGIELNPAYAELAARRLQQLSLLAEGVA